MSIEQVGTEYQIEKTKLNDYKDVWKVKIIW